MDSGNAQLEEATPTQKTYEEKVADIERRRAEEINDQGRIYLTMSAYNAKSDRDTNPDSIFKGMSDEEIDAQFDKELSAINEFISLAKRKGIASDKIAKVVNDRIANTNVLRYRKGGRLYIYAETIDKLPEGGFKKTVDIYRIYDQELERLKQEYENTKTQEANQEVNYDFSNIKPIGKGFFGNIYDQFKGKAKEAVAFLLQKKEGDIVGALNHKDIGDIDLVWGKEGNGKSDGYGLSKIAKYHPEVLDNLQGILNDMLIISRTDNRIQLESPTHKVAIRLEFDGEKKKWLLTAFEKENSLNSKTTDTTTTQEVGKGDSLSNESSTANIQQNTFRDTLSDFDKKENEAKTDDEQVDDEPDLETHLQDGNYTEGDVQSDFDVFSKFTGGKTENKPTEDEQSKDEVTEHQTSNKDYSIIKTTNNKGTSIFEFRNNKTGKIVKPSEKTKQKYLIEHINNSEYEDTPIPENASERDAETIINTESKNPKELALTLYQMSKYEDITGSKEWAIAETARRIKADSFYRFGDKNNTNKSIALSYFSRVGRANENTSNNTIDRWAFDASNLYKGDYGGDEITTDDIIDFIYTYKAGAEQALRQKNEQYKNAEDRFREITGLNPTEKVLRAILNKESISQENSAEKSRKAELEYERIDSERRYKLDNQYNEWFNSLSLDDKIKELQKSYPYESNGLFEKENSRNENEPQPTDTKGQSDTNDTNKDGAGGGSKESPEYRRLISERRETEARLKSAKENLNKPQLGEYTGKEYVVWGIPEGEKDERPLLTSIRNGDKSLKLTTREQAEKGVKLVKGKGATSVRIQEIDLGGNLNEFKNPIQFNIVPYKASRGLEAVYDKAVKMFQEHIPLEKIWEETGFFLRQNTKDNSWEWAYRIDQNKMKLNLPTEMKAGDRYKLSEIISYPEFFNIFAKAKDIDVRVVNNPNRIMEAGLSKDGKLLVINLAHYDINAKNEPQTKNIIGHELQHFVQLSVDNTSLNYKITSREKANYRTILKRKQDTRRESLLNDNLSNTQRKEIESKIENIQNAIDYLDGKRNIPDNVKKVVDQELERLGYYGALTEREARLSESDYTQSPYKSHNKDAEHLGIEPKDFEAETKHLREKLQINNSNENRFVKVAPEKVKALIDKIQKSVRGSFKNQRVFYDKAEFQRRTGISYEKIGGLKGVKFSQDLASVNNKFNGELRRLIDGKLPSGHIFQLGRPSEILKASGIPDLPIELKAEKLKEKSTQKEHPFDLDNVSNLSQAIQNPLAVFDSSSVSGRKVILTELQQGDKNFVVALELNFDKGSIQVNDIRSVYPRNNTQIVRSIANNEALYLNKEKISDWISRQRFNSAEATNLSDTATKIVKDFENPISDNEIGKVQFAIDSNRSEGQGAKVQYFKTKDGHIYGAKFENGDIYFDEDMLNHNTTIHEFSHIWEQMFPKAWEKGLEHFKETSAGKKLFAELKREGNYNHLSDEQIWSEAMNTFIGDYGEKKQLKPKEGSAMERLMNWVRDFFKNTVGRVLGKSDVTPETKFGEFADRVYKDLVGGKELKAETNIPQSEVPKKIRLMSNAEIRKLLEDGGLIEEATCP